VDAEDDDNDNEGPSVEQSKVLQFHDGNGGDDDVATDQDYDVVDLIDDFEEYFVHQFV